MVLNVVLLRQPLTESICTRATDKEKIVLLPSHHMLRVWRRDLVLEQVLAGSRGSCSIETLIATDLDFAFAKVVYVNYGAVFKPLIRQLNPFNRTYRIFGSPQPLIHGETLKKVKV